MQKIILITGLLLFLLPSGNFGGVGRKAHDFHLSKCLVEVNEKDKAVQISIHIFIDDLEEALRRQGADQLFICTAKENPNAEKQLFKYLQQRFRLEINGKAASLNFVGKEPSEDLSGVWCYLEAPNVSSVREFTITFDLLMEIFDDQKNIINISGPGGKRGFFLFQNGKITDSVAF